MSKQNRFQVSGFRLQATLLTIAISITLLSGCARKTPEKLLTDAQQAAQQMDFTNAIIKLEDFLKLYPNDPRAPLAQTRMADMYANSRQYDRAIEEYQKVVSTYPANSEYITEAKFGMANCYAQENKFDKAREVWMPVSEDTSNPYAALMAKFNVAKSYEHDTSWNEAIKTYKKILGSLPYKDPHFPKDKLKDFSERATINAIQDLAHATYLSGNVKEAVALYKSLQNKFPENEFAQGVGIWSNVVIGDIYSQEKQHKKAKEFYNKAIATYAKITTDKLLPDKAAWATMKIGEIYELHLNDIPKATEMYQTVTKNYSKSQWVPFAQRGLLHIAQSTTSQSTTGMTQPGMSAPPPQPAKKK